MTSVYRLLIASLLYALTAYHPASAQENTTLRAGKTPEETLQNLYHDKLYVSKLGALSYSEVERFSCCFTQTLIDHFANENALLAKWHEDHKGEQLKPPLGCLGNVFTADYGGIDEFSITNIELSGDTATAMIHFSFTPTEDLAFMYADNVGKPIHWNDKAILKRVGGLWYLDDIHFGVDGHGMRFSLKERYDTNE